MAKNPWMSAYLSAANKMANAARGQMMGAAKAEQKKTQKNMMDAWFDMFTPPAAKSTASKKPAAKKTAAKKTAAKKPAARKPAAKKTAAKRTSAKKSTTRRSSGR